MVNLKKYIEPGSLRDIGSRPSGIAPCNLPVAGRSREVILSAMGCEGLAINRISAENAFVVRYGESIYYLFVRPEYSQYRNIARLRFSHIPQQYHVDHILAKNLAVKLGYRYVLVALVPGRVNSLHGLYEKQLREAKDIPDVCFADERIFDKALIRVPENRRTRSILRQGYDPHAQIDLDLTLKQRGQWNTTFGFDRPAPEEFVHSLEPL